MTRSCVRELGGSGAWLGMTTLDVNHVTDDVTTSTPSSFSSMSGSLGDFSTLYAKVDLFALPWCAGFASLKMSSKDTVMVGTGGKGSSHTSWGCLASGFRLWVDSRCCRVPAKNKISLVSLLWARFRSRSPGDLFHQSWEKKWEGSGTLTKSWIRFRAEPRFLVLFWNCSIDSFMRGPHGTEGSLFLRVLCSGPTYRFGCLQRGDKFLSNCAKQSFWKTSKEKIHCWPGKEKEQVAVVVVAAVVVLFLQRTSK